MPAFNFSKEFADDVEGGIKLRTIRSSERCKPYDPVYLYTAMRTKACRKLGESICTGVFPVTIAEDGPYLGHKDVHNYVRIGSADAWAKKDGFKDYAAMRAWFKETHGLPYQGWVHEWLKPGIAQANCLTSESKLHKRKKRKSP